MNKRDHQARAAEITDCDPPDEGTVRNAMLMCCANAQSPDEAVEFMRMLGIHPSQQDDPTYDTKVPNLPTSGATRISHPIPSYTQNTKNKLNPQTRQPVKEQVK